MQLEWLTRNQPFKKRLAISSFDNLLTTGVRTLNTISSIMTITPEVATRWLEGNTSNRTVRQSAVDQYASDMKKGRWKLNGATISFSESGRLIDGQHRLFACVMADAPFESVVVTGLADDVSTTIDQGRFRNPGDHLKIAGHDFKGNQSRYAASLGYIVQYDSGTITHKLRASPQDLVEAAAKNVGLGDWVLHVRGALPQGIKGFTSPVAAVTYIGKRNGDHIERIETFLHRLGTGAGLDDGSPILSLRNRIINNSPRQQPERFYIVVTSWNNFAKGRSLHKIAPTKDGHMPKIVGDND